MAALSEIRTQRLLLNPLAPGDIPTIMALANNPRIAEVTLNIPYPDVHAYVVLRQDWQEAKGEEAGADAGARTGY